MFNFTSLLGAQSESRASQSLLELDGGVKVLVDVGWDAAYAGEQLQALERHVATLSFVLLTHPTADHLGAYAHCCKHIPLFSRVPVYATTPVIHLGRTLLGDVYASSPVAASIVPASAIAAPATASTADASTNILLPPPTAEEIGAYFARINPLKFSQPHQPVAAPWSPPLSGLTITAYGAGHTLGGTIWHIQQGMESIVYAAGFNQGRENLLPGTALLAGGREVIEPLRRPTALLCAANGTQREDVLRGVKKRDDSLISLIQETVAQGGKVLVPTDSSARVLELAFVLERNWRENMTGPHADTYRRTRVYMATRYGDTTMRYLQSMLEWVDESVRGEAEAALTARGKDGKELTSPLDFQWVKVLERQRQLERVLARRRPCVVLASDSSLEWGFSRQVLQSVASDSRNLVILPEPLDHAATAQGGVGKRLWELWRNEPGQISAQSGAKVVTADGVVVEMAVANTAPLDANETALYETYVARQQQLHSTLQGDNTVAGVATAAAEEQEDESESEDEDEDEDSEHQGRALNVSAQMTQSNKRKAGRTDAELGVDILLRGDKHVFDYDVRSKRGKDKVFPFATQRNRDDDFGEAIRPDDYLRAEERDTMDGVDLRDGTKTEAAVGQKRKWDDVAAAAGTKASARGPKADSGKRQKRDKAKPREPDDIDAAIARATGQNLPGEHVNGGAVDEKNGNEGEDNDDDDDDDEEPDEDDEDDEEQPLEEALAEGPQKVVFSSQQVTLRMKITHVDFSGLHEKRDLQMIIPLIRPGKLILVSGDQNETTGLADACRDSFTRQGDGTGTPDIFLPRVGETVDASVDTNAWTLKLSRQLVRRIHPQKVKEGLQIVAVTGRLDVEPAETAEKHGGDGEGPQKKVKREAGADDSASKDRDSAEASRAGIPILDLLTWNASSGPQQLVTQPVHVGDLRLATLRTALEALGHQCALRGEGTILVDNTVLVRKSASGRIEVESAARGLEPPAWRTRDTQGSFFAVRKAVYDGLAVVAGV